MRKFGLIGYPLGHSLSADFFADKFRNEGIIDCVYSKYPIKSIDELPKLLSDDTEICGLNVTIPYKSEVLKYVDKVDPAAVEIGAVNVLGITRKNGKTLVHGFNSDIAGIGGSLASIPTGQLQNALVLGTGGASKAVVYTLKKLGINYKIVSRQRENDILGYGDIDSALLGESRLIINTTPLGMYPNVDSKPEIDYSQLDSRHTLFDVVYNPEKTLFLKIGEEKGCHIITGMEMFRLQAERSWAIWNGR